MTAQGAATASSDARAKVQAHPLWYHVMELAPGLVTPGWFDLRPIVERLPWPDVEGKRCLDVGPWDGFYAFELERRGAAEVVAADISDHREWDAPVRTRELQPEVLDAMAGPELGRGLAIAKEITNSKVERVEVNAYDLSPETVGEFDVVTCGSLLLHLRDPIVALEAIRSVCREHFMSVETIDIRSDLLLRRRPTARVRAGEMGAWWIPNRVGHRKLLEAAGFEIEKSTKTFGIPLGPGHGQSERHDRSTFERVLEGVGMDGSGIPHAAALTRPDPALSGLKPQRR